MIILRSLCLLHHASSLDNSTRVVMVDDVSTADFVSTAVRRPSRVDAMLCFGAIFVEAEEPVRFPKRRQSSAIDRLHDQNFCVTTRMGMIFGYLDRGSAHLTLRYGYYCRIIGRVIIPHRVLSPRRIPRGILLLL